MLGHSLLSQFENIPLDEITLPYIDSREKPLRSSGRSMSVHRGRRAPSGVQYIGESRNSGLLSILPTLCIWIASVFLLPHWKLNWACVRRITWGVLTVFPIQPSTRAHRRNQLRSRARRWLVAKDWNRADVTLVGVSRTGKTPTCLYLALQYGIYAANYPLIPGGFPARGASCPDQEYAKQVVWLYHRP